MPSFFRSLLKSKRYFWSIHPKWINSGNTPTRKLDINVAYDLRDSPLPDGFTFPLPANPEQIPASISPNLSIESVPYNIFGDDLVAISEGKKHFYIWGVARYHDVFPATPKRITKFCCYIGNITGNPIKGFDKDSNIVEIAFPVYPLHNCSDEECGNNE